MNKHGEGKDYFPELNKLKFKDSDSSGQTKKKECVIHKDRVCHDEFEDRRIECERIRELKESLTFWLNRVKCANAFYDSSSTTKIGENENE